MASQHLSQSYSERTLLALEQALRDVWQFSRHTIPIMIGRGILNFSKVWHQRSWTSPMLA